MQDYQTMSKKFIFEAKRENLIYFLRYLLNSDNVVRIKSMYQLLFFLELAFLFILSKFLIKALLRLFFKITKSNKIAVGINQPNFWIFN